MKDDDKAPGLLGMAWTAALGLVTVGWAAVACGAVLGLAVRVFRWAAGV